MRTQKMGTPRPMMANAKTPPLTLVSQPASGAVSWSRTFADAAEYARPPIQPTAT